MGSVFAGQHDAPTLPPELEPLAPLDPEAALSPFKVEEWRRLTPAERLERAWALRDRVRDPRGVHDRKLFPAP